jgi:hypothetical protein
VDKITKNTTVRPRRIRVWMTGSIAVVTSALVAWSIDLDPDGDADRSRRAVRASPYGVAETVQRIEQAARGRGLHVLWVTEGDAPVIVLASSAGGTPMVMRDGAAVPDAPLALQVRAREDGGAAVHLGAADADWRGALRDVSPVVADEVAALALLVERALSG